VTFKNGLAKPTFPSLKMFNLPPGPVYVFALLPKFIVSSITVYLSLLVLQDRLHLDIPTLLVVAAVALARPVLFIVTQYYRIWANKRAAIANGAILPPQVRESTFSIISSLRKSIQSGYPGAQSVFTCLVRSNTSFCRGRYA
jgi:hypothetical protein